MIVFTTTKIFLALSFTTINSGRIWQLPGITGHGTLVSWNLLKKSPKKKKKSVLANWVSARSHFSSPMNGETWEKYASRFTLALYLHYPTLMGTLTWPECNYTINTLWTFQDGQNFPPNWVWEIFLNLIYKSDMYSFF